MELAVDLFAWPEGNDGDPPGGGAPSSGANEAAAIAAVEQRLTGFPPVRSWQLQHCTQVHGSATTRELAPFFEELADSVRAQVEAFLAPGAEP